VLKTFNKFKLLKEESLIDEEIIGFNNKKKFKDVKDMKEINLKAHKRLKMIKERHQ
jgi:hypothetical protein